MTGPAGNIGLATTRLFLAEGARVLLVDRDAERLAAVASELGAKSAETSSPTSPGRLRVEAYASAAEARLGPVHAFFNNAGIEGPIKQVADHPAEGFEQVMAVNATGVFLGMKHVLPRTPE